MGHPLDDLLEDLKSEDGEASPYPKIDRYEIVREVARGGMGVIYEARDPGLKRRVALKVLNDAKSNPRRIERLRREATAMAKIRHPNIVPVHEVGSAGDSGEPLHFLVMDFVEGETLADAWPSLSPNHRYAVMQILAEAVGYAHRNGILHRDLKPANVLLERAQPPERWGLPWRVYLTDFGLARVREEEALTRTGTVMGTTDYMAPEQVTGDVHRMGPATDVWALGVMLYELTTDSRPFPGRTPLESYDRIRKGTPIPMRTLNLNAPADVVALVEKCLEKAPGRRFGDAGELAEELRRFLSGEPIRVRRGGPIARAWRRISRHPKTSIAIGFLAAILVGLLSLGLREARFSRLRMETAVHLESAGRLEEAREIYRKTRGGGTGAERVERKIAEREAGRERRLREALALFEQGRPAIDEALRYLYTSEKRYEELLAKVDSAQRMIEEGIEKAPWLASGHYLLGRAWEIRGWWDRAEASWRKAIELDPQFSPARFRLGRMLVVRACLATIGRFSADTGFGRRETGSLAEEAVAHLEKAGSGLKEPLHRDLAEGLLALSRRDMAAVERCVAKGLQDYAGKEGCEEFHWLAGRAASTDAAAIRAYDEAIRICSRHVLARFFRGSLRYETGNRPGALEDLSEAIRVAPRFADAYCRRGIVRWSHRDPGSALEDFTKAIDSGDDLPHAYFNRGVAHHEIGNYERAIADYDRALTLNPRFADAYNNRGNSRLALEQLPLALLDYSASLDLDPGTALVWANRGAVRFLLGDKSGAIADSTRAIEIAPKFADAYAQRGKVYCSLDDHASALRDWKTALEIAPHDWPRRKEIEELLRKH